jgi:glutathione S-transferase
MILRTTNSSPFGRKPLMAARYLGLMDRIKVEPADPMNPDDVLRRDNPLGKMPVLILDDGRTIFDSRVILEYFDMLAGGDRIIPASGNARFDALTMQSLADGMSDAGLLIVYEGRYRPDDKHHTPWLDYQRGKIERSLARLVSALPDPTQVNVGTIALSAALGYLDWRKQVDWRNTAPALVPWLDTFRATTPIYDETSV